MIHPSQLGNKVFSILVTSCPIKKTMYLELVINSLEENSRLTAFWISFKPVKAGMSTVTKQ